MTPAAEIPELLDLLAERINRPLLIRQADVPGFLGISASAFFKLRAADAFPRPVALSAGQTMYRRRDLEVWVEKLKQTRG